MKKQKRFISKKHKKLTKSLVSDSIEINRLNKEISAINSMLSSLKRRNKSGTWSTKKLINRLNNNQIKIWNVKKGNIRKINTNFTKTQLTAIKKALTQFKKSKTSTNRGIRDVSENIKEGIRKSLSTDFNISDRDVQDFYEMFGDTDLTHMNYVELMGASAMFVNIQDAKEAQDTKQEFIDRLSTYEQIQDLNDRKRAERLYDKYIKGRL